MKSVIWHLRIKHSISVVIQKLCTQQERNPLNRQNTAKMQWYLFPPSSLSSVQPKAYQISPQQVWFTPLADERGVHCMGIGRGLWECQNTPSAEVQC